VLQQRGKIASLLGKECVWPRGERGLLLKGENMCTLRMHYNIEERENDG